MTTQQELASWIDTGVLAEAVVDTLEEADLEPNLGTAKKLWLRLLDELYGDLRGIVKWDDP